VLKYCTDLGLSSIELMGDVAENFAGAPHIARGPGGGRRQLTPEQQEAGRRAAEERKQWRLAASMDKYKKLRRMYNNAGVTIDVFKLPPSPSMSDEEIDYVFTVGRTLGANSLTMELPGSADFTKRMGDFAAKHKLYVGYHNHMQVNETSWDAALAQSKYNSINLDVGHFTEAISGSPIPFIRKNHARITSFHLKDKRYGKNGGGNTEWGKGEVPLKEVLQLMAREKYKWPANIELEYNIPEGSTVMAEMAKCIAFCKSALQTT
jgi:sugar phosphate isomerase/epimerase